MRRLLVLLGLTIACSDGTGPGSALATTVSLSRSLVTPFDSITVRIRLSNPTPRAIQIVGTTPCFITFTVQAAGRDPRSADPRACPAVLEEVTLRAGEVREVRIAWNLTVDGEPLPLGQYAVQAGLALADQAGLQALSEPKPLQIVVFGR
jgi:hypothetical protein